MNLYKQIETMKAKTLFLLPFVILVACGSNEISNGTEDKHEKKYNLLNKGAATYLDWYLSDMESFVPYIFRQYPSDAEGSSKVYDRYYEENTYALKNDISVRIHDEYALESDSKTTTLHLTRTAKVLKNETAQNAPKRFNDEDESVSTHTYTYSLQTVQPINLIRPVIDICDAIPFCYYDNFEIEWSPDYNNDNGVVVIAEWTGVTLNDPTQGTIVGIDIVEDTGLAVINTDIFTGMPDEALVNLWLIRGNLITINGDEEEIHLQDIQYDSPEVLTELLNQHPELLLQLQPYMFGTGAVSKFSFILVREL